MLKHRRMPPPVFDPVTGNAAWPTAPTDTQPGDTGTRKMLLYSEFPMMEHSLVSVSHFFVASFDLISKSVHADLQALYVNGIKALSIHGKVSMQLRESRIADWADPKSDVSVLIISIVGSVGLNLTAADVVFHFVSLFFSI